MRFSGEPFGSPERLRCLLVGLITGRVIAPASGSSIARGSSRTAFSSQNTANCRYSLRSESLTAARTQLIHWSACSRYSFGDNTYRLQGRPTKYTSTPLTEVNLAFGHAGPAFCIFLARPTFAARAICRSPPCKPRRLFVGYPSLSRVQQRPIPPWDNRPIASHLGLLGGRQIQFRGSRFYLRAVSS